MYIKKILTNNVQRDEEGAHGLRGDLALVDSGVALLRPLHMQRPIVGVRRVHRLEPLVGRVRVPAHCQDVQVAMSDPRYLPTDITLN